MCVKDKILERLILQWILNQQHQRNAAILYQLVPTLILPHKVAVLAKMVNKNVAESYVSAIPCMASRCLSRLVQSELEAINFFYYTGVGPLTITRYSYIAKFL